MGRFATHNGVLYRGSHAPHAGTCCIWLTLTPMFSVLLRLAWLVNILAQILHKDAESPICFTMVSGYVPGSSDA